MGTQIESTSNNTEDITTIINQINSLFNNDSISNALTIVAYDQLTLTVPGTDGTQTSASFTHNLGYAPMFMVFLNYFGDQFFIPQTIASYNYNSGPKAQGSYPYILINSTIDTIKLTVNIFVFSNPNHFSINGDFTFNLYLFSRPIAS